jgi:quinol monooxygenase YgiN
METIRLLNLIEVPESDVEAAEGALARLTQIAIRLGHAERAELLRDVDDPCRFVFELEFRDEERLADYFSDPERIAVLHDAPDAVRSRVRRYELTAVRCAASL